MSEKLPTRITDYLRFVGWKMYAGNEPILEGYWIKDGIAVKIQPARRMARMWHVNYVSPKLNEHRFIEEDKLMKIIESGKL